MKQCPTCNYTFEGEGIICPNCGAYPVQDISDARNHSVVDRKNKPIRNKHINHKRIIPIGIVLCLVCFIAIIIISQAGTISAKKYIIDSPTFSGYDGFAKISDDDVFDYELLELDIGEQKRVAWDTDPFDYIDIEVDKTDHISNGDVVTATITINYDRFNSFEFDKKLGGKKKYTKKYTAKGLEEPTVIDPFEGAKYVVYDKTSNQCIIKLDDDYGKDFGIFHVSYNDEHIIVSKPDDAPNWIGYKYNIDDLETNNCVTVSIDCDDDKYGNYGILISPTSKQIEPIISDYLINGNNILKEDYNELISLATHEMKSYSTKPDLKFIKAYFSSDRLSDGSYADTGCFNQICCLFSYNFYGRTRYAHVDFNDVKQLSTGVLFDPYENISTKGVGHVRYANIVEDSVEDFEATKKAAWITSYELKIK